MCSSLNSLKGVIWEISSGSTIGVIQGDTRSLDNGSYVRLRAAFVVWPADATYDVFHFGAYLQPHLPTASLVTPSTWGVHTTKLRVTGVTDRVCRILHGFGLTVMFLSM